MSFEPCVLLGPLQRHRIPHKNKAQCFTLNLLSPGGKHWCSALEVCEPGSWKFIPCVLWQYDEDIFAAAIAEDLWKRENGTGSTLPRSFLIDTCLTWCQPSPVMEGPQLPERFSSNLVQHFSMFTSLFIHPQMVFAIFATGKVGSPLIMIHHDAQKLLCRNAM